MMKKKNAHLKSVKNKHQKINTHLDAIKAMRRGSREAEMELLGPGFHSSDRVHQSKKTYTRKEKHKNGKGQDGD